MTVHRRFFVASLVAAAAARASAQAYPSRPIRLLVPSPPGGGTDTLARLVATRLTETLQWQIVADNRPGAGGNLGMDALAKSAPDGYTLAMGESANLAINPFLYARMPFDAARDLSPIVLVGTVPLVLVVAPGRGLDTLAAIVVAARARPMSFASSGNGTVGHMVGEMWKGAAGIPLLHVPYKGAGPVMTDLIGGQVDLHFASFPAAAALIRAGKLQPLAVTTARRTALLPDVPTLAELGYHDFDYRVFYGLVAPSGTPVTVIDRLQAEVQRVLQAPEVRSTLMANGVEPAGGTPAQFAAFLDAQRSLWERVVKTSGARVD